MTETRTIVAPATPSGESAIAVTRVSGPLAREIAVSMARGRPLVARQAWHGDYVTVDGAVADDVLFCFFAGPKSYTGDDVLEISSHGNPFIVRKVVDDCLRRGCEPAEPGEFTRRAFLNGRLNLTEAEAVMDVIRARSDRALEVAQRQLRGALGRRVDAFVDRLLRCCAMIEAYIDFPDEDLPAEDQALRLTEVRALLEEIGRLHATRQRGDLIREGLHVVLLGEPNAGKSSLLNQLVGFDRAIVSNEPGTTRDFLEEPLALGAHRIRVIDTAGLRETTGEIEAAGVARTLERAEVADLFVLIVDATRPPPSLPDGIMQRLTAENSVIAINKTDLPARVFAGFAGVNLPSVEVSALTGAGIDDLRAALSSFADRLTGQGMDDELLAVNARHAAALTGVLECLRRAETLLVSDEPLELAGSELRGAVEFLRQIVGHIDNETILDHLFANFCIGK